MPTATDPTPTLAGLLPVGATKLLDLTAASAPGLPLASLLDVLAGAGTLRLSEAERTTTPDSVRVQGNAELNFLNLVRLPKLPISLEAKALPVGLRFTTAFALPTVRLRQLLGGFGGAALPLPSQFDLAFAGGPVQVQQSPNNLQFQYATTMAGLGPAAFLAKCTPAAQSRWQAAAALDLGATPLSGLPGLGVLRAVESVFPLSSLLLVVSSADADGFDEGDFALPELAAAGTPAISSDKLQQVDSVKKGLNVYGKWQLNSTKREQKLLRTLLGLDQQVSVVLQVGTDPGEGSSLYASKTTTIKGMPFSCQVGGQLSAGTVSLFVNGTLEATIQGRAVQFDANMVFMPNGALLAGSMLGTVAFAGITLSNLGLAVGLSWEGLPSLGIAATLTLASFNSALAVLFDSAEPTKSMLAGAISDLTLNDVVTTFTQTATPAQLADVLKQVRLTATSDQVLADGSQGAAALQAVVAALDGRDLDAIAAALAKVGIAVPTASAEVLLTTAVPGQKWHLTDLRTVLHYELTKQGDTLRVALSPQLYVVPQDTGIGALAFKQGFFINAKLTIFFLEASVKILVKPTEGIAAAGNLAPITLGHPNLFSLRAATDPTKGPSVSLATFSQTVAAPPAPAPAPTPTPTPAPNQPYNPGQPYQNQPYGPNQPYTPGQPYPNQPYNPGYGAYPGQPQPYTPGGGAYPGQPYGPGQPYPNQPYNPGQPYQNQPYGPNQPYPNQPYNPGYGGMPAGYPQPPAAPKPAAAPTPTTVVKGPHFQLDGELTLLGMKRGVAVNIDGSGATFALTGTITPGVTADFQGRFKGPKDLRVSGSVNVGIDSIDFGMLGRLNLYSGVQASVSLGVDSNRAWATFQGKVQAAGQTVTLPTLDLSIETGSFAELPQQLARLVRTALQDLFKDAAKWAAFVQQGLLTGVQDVGMVFASYYRLSADQMAQAFAKAGYNIDVATRTLMNYFGEGIFGAAKALKTVGYPVAYVGDSLARVGGYITSSAVGAAGNAAGAVASALGGAGYPIREVGSYLVNNLRVNPKDLVTVFQHSGYPLNEIGSYLQKDFRFTAGAVVGALKSAGYAMSTIAPFLAANFTLGLNELLGAYKEAGYALGEAAGAIKGAGYAVQDAGNALKSTYAASASATLGGLRTAGYAVQDAAQFVAKSFVLNDQALAASMKGANCAAAEVSGALVAAFGTTQATATQVLATVGYGGTELLGALKSTYNLPKEGAAQLVKALNYASTDAANALKNTYGVAREDAARLLKNVGYPADQTAQAVMGAYNVTRDEAGRVLGVVGYGANEVSNALGTAGNAIASGATTVINGIGGLFGR